MAGAGWLIVIVTSGLRLLGLEFDESQVGAAIQGLIEFIGFLLAIFGQLRRDDLSYGLLRK